MSVQKHALHSLPNFSRRSQNSKVLPLRDGWAHSRRLGALYEASALLSLTLLSCGTPLHLQCKACRSAALAKKARDRVYAVLRTRLRR
jgi:hypothetical protein